MANNLPTKQTNHSIDIHIVCIIYKTSIANLKLFNQNLANLYVLVENVYELIISRHIFNPSFKRSDKKIKDISALTNQIRTHEHVSVTNQFQLYICINNNEIHFMKIENVMVIQRIEHSLACWQFVLCQWVSLRVYISCIYYIPFINKKVIGDFVY
jgi:hypothetical protein